MRQRAALYFIVCVILKVQRSINTLLVDPIAKRLSSITVINVGTRYRSIFF